MAACSGALPAKARQSPPTGSTTVARLVKRTALAAGVRGALPEGERGRMFAGHDEQVTNGFRVVTCPLAVTLVVMSEPW